MAARPDDINYYRQLAERFRARILRGELPNGAQLDSIRSISEKERLSIATVSKALDCLVGDGLLRKVPRKGIFVAGGAAEHTAAQKIGILVPVFDDHELQQWSLFGAALPKVQRRLLPEGKRISVHHCRIHPNDQYLWDYVPAEEIAGYGLDGILIVGLYDFGYLAALARLRIPMAAFDVDASNLGLDSAFVDNIGTAMRLTRILLERGHRNIIFVGGPLNQPYGQEPPAFDPAAVERATGYELALRMLAPELPRRVFHARSRDADGSKSALIGALQQSPECTAIVGEGLIGEQEAGGRKIETVGFRSVAHAHLPVASHVAAYAECNFPSMAVGAVEMLLSRMENPLQPVRRQAAQPEIKIMKPARA